MVKQIYNQSVIVGPSVTIDLANYHKFEAHLDPPVSPIELEIKKLSEGWKMNYYNQCNKVSGYNIPMFTINSNT